jgi:surface antigen
MSAIDAFLRSPQAIKPPSGVVRAQNLEVIAGYTTERGQACRIVQRTVYLDGRQPVRAKGTVCEQSDKRWALVPGAVLATTDASGSSVARGTEVKVAGRGSAAAAPLGIKASSAALDSLAVEAFLQSPVATHLAPGVSEGLRISVTKGFKMRRNGMCRVIEQSIRVNGFRVRATGTMCQHSDGSWALVTPQKLAKQP